MAETRCPGCPSGVKETGEYLCLDCWSTLPRETRIALNRRDSKGMAWARLLDLHGQIRNGVPLDQVQVTP